MKLKLSCIFFSLIVVSCSPTQYKNHIEIETQFGNIEVEVYPDKAPKTVAAFLSYVDAGLYKKGSFYRVLKEDNQPAAAFRSELIQGGIWQTNSKKVMGLQGIPHETTKQSGLSHLDGTISLARTTPGTASSEFFICVGDQPAYDYGNNANPDKLGYAAFGRVVKGMDVVRKIHSQPENGESFDPVIGIFNIVRQ